MTEISVTDRLHDRLMEAATPVMDLLSEIDYEIAEHEKVIAELRITRRKVAAITKAINPPEAKPKPQKKNVSEEKLANLTGWLQARAAELNGNGGFYASELLQHDDLPVANESVLSVALRILRERDVIVLDHLGTKGKKFYKVLV